jgi:short-subunit dehydrogenase
VFVHSYRMLASAEQCHIMNTASMGGLLSAPFVGPYAAAKHAVVGLSQSLRVELAGTNVGVTLVCPGNVRTNLAQTMRHQHDGQPRTGSTDLDDFLYLLEAGVHDENAMDPADVGKLVVRAIKANQILAATQRRTPTTAGGGRLRGDAYEHLIAGR